MRFPVAVILGSLSIAGATAQPYITLRDSASMQMIGRSVQIFEDTSATMSLTEVQHSGIFHPSTSLVPNMGLSRSAFWVRFTVFNSGQDNSQFLSIPNPEIEEVDTYIQRSDGSYKHFTGGQSRRLDKWTRRDIDHTINYILPSTQISTIYIRLHSHKQIQIPIYLGSSNATLTKLSFRDGFAGAYVGLMLVMLLYNLFIFIFSRDRDYIIYVIYVFFVGITQANFLGIAKLYIWGNQIFWSTKASIILTIVTAVIANIFMQRFIHAKKHAPKLIKFSWLIYLSFAIGLGINLFSNPLVGYDILQISAGVMAMYQLTVAFVSYLKKARTARYFLLAWSVFLVGIILYVLKDLGVIPYNELTQNMMTIGSAVEVVLLSFGLADKINVLRQEKELSQAKAIAMAKENELFVVNQNVELERKVTERTHALQETNDHLKRTQTQLVSAEKMASLGQLTAGIAHEINNPLNFISSNIPPLKRDLLDLKEVLDAYRNVAKDGAGLEDVRALEERIGVDFTVNEVQEILKCMETGASRTSEIVRGLRTFSRLDEDDLKLADINEGLRSTVVVLGPKFRDVVRIEYELGDIPKVECYPGKLNQVFMNLLNNAAHAVKQRHGNTGGVIKIATCLSGEAVTITITDNGMGMDGSVQSRLFEPFFTTKNVGEGTGLGLSIVQGIIEKHNGVIELESTVGQGTRFTLTLPVVQTVKLAKSA